MILFPSEFLIYSATMEYVGELLVISWKVDAKTLEYSFETEPDRISGGGLKLNIIANRGYYATVFSQGREWREPLTLEWSALPARDLEVLKYIYLSRSGIIANYKSYKNIISRIVELDYSRIYQTDFYMARALIVPYRAFRVYRSIDYGQTYQPASYRVVDKFVDYGFVWSGQVRYRIQYEPPEFYEPGEVETEYPKIQTQHLSFYKTLPQIMQKCEPVTAFGSAVLVDIMKAGADGKEGKASGKSFELTPPAPTISHSVEWGWQDGFNRGPVVIVSLNFDLDYPQQYDDLLITGARYIYDVGTGQITKDDDFDVRIAVSENASYIVQAAGINSYGVGEFSEIEGIVPDYPIISKSMSDILKTSLMLGKSDVILGGHWVDEKVILENFKVTVVQENNHIKGIESFWYINLNYSDIMPIKYSKGQSWFEIEGQGIHYV